MPDLAGWRRERMPQLPEGVGITLAPDWVSVLVRAEPFEALELELGALWER